MDETPSPASSRRDSTPRSGPLRKNHRHAVADDDDDDGGNPIECTGKSCQSCTTGLIADCVAICCCPCAVVDILAFTFLKIPYLMGRKWLRKGKRKMRKLEKKRKCERNNSVDHHHKNVVNGDVFSRKDSLDHEGSLEISSMEFEDHEDLKDNFSARFEAEEIWLELYQIGHLGFGRVSFTGIPCQGKSNNN